MRAAVITLSLLLVGVGCQATDATISPARVSQRGGAELRVRLAEPIGEGGVVVLVDGTPATQVVIEGPELVRARLPSLPRTGSVDVELVFADGQTVTFAGAVEVEAPRFEVEARAVD